MYGSKETKETELLLDILINFLTVSMYGVLQRANISESQIYCCIHNQMNFVRTNVVETIAGVVVVLLPPKMKNANKFIFAKQLRCIVNQINHIHMYFVCIIQSRPLRE